MKITIRAYCVVTERIHDDGTVRECRMSRDYVRPQHAQDVLTRVRVSEPHARIVETEHQFDLTEGRQLRAFHLRISSLFDMCRPAPATGRDLS